MHAESGFWRLQGEGRYTIVSLCSQRRTCAMRPPFFLFVLPKRKNAPRPVEERKGRSQTTAFCASPSARGRLRFSAAAEVFETAVFLLEAAAVPRRTPGEFQKGLASPVWSFQLGRFLGGENAALLFMPPAAGPQTPCGARKTVRAYACPPCRDCRSRACFATARQRRGCGNCRLPSSATGSGSQQFLAFFDRCGNCGLASPATGSARPQFLIILNSGWSDCFLMETCGIVCPSRKE